MAQEIDVENKRNSNFEGLVTLTLTFDPAIRHIVLQQSSTSTYIPTFIQIEETFCGRTDVRTGGRTFFPSILLGRLSEVDLKIVKAETFLSTNIQFCICCCVCTKHLCSCNDEQPQHQQTSQDQCRLITLMSRFTGLIINRH